jgi:phospholipase C
MQENRSFDHYFGTLKGVRGFADTATISLPGLRSVFEQPSGGERQFPFPLRSASGSADAALRAQCQGDIAHGWADQHAAWNGGLLDAWMDAKNKIGTLGYLDRADLPFYHAVADAYTICDAYHCSVIGSTGPNRTFLWSGTIDAEEAYNGPAYDGGEESGLAWTNYAQALEAAGVSWKLYQNAADNFGDNGLAYFAAFENAAAGSPLWQKGMASVPAQTGVTPDDILAAIHDDVVNQALPEVTWIVTDQWTSEHPSGPDAPVNGENFVRDLLDALAADPETFDSTVVFVTYDENGGFFDHVPPPVPAAGTPGEFVQGMPVGLGFRVPMLVLSPWTRGGWVSSEVFDHTSVLRFLERWTSALGKPALCPLISEWRRSVSGDLSSLFDFQSPVFGLPDLPQPSQRIPAADCNVENPVPEINSRPAQEPGNRPARALPYQPNAWVSELRVAGDVIQLDITMTNEGAVASRPAHFAVYANAHRDGGPWPYLVGAHDAAQGLDGSVTDLFNIGQGFGDGRYDLTVVGPNRFLRHFAGDATAAGKDLEVVSRYAVDPSTGRLSLYLDMVNRSASGVTFTIRANAFRRADLAWTHEVEAGGTASAGFDQLFYADGWYDFQVTSDADASWSRRFTGHLETGLPSVSSDPESTGRDDDPVTEPDPNGGTGPTPNPDPSDNPDPNVPGPGTEPSGGVSGLAGGPTQRARPNGDGGCTIGPGRASSVGTPALLGLGAAYLLRRRLGPGSDGQD